MTGAPAPAAIDHRTVGYLGRALWSTAMWSARVWFAIQVPTGGEPVIFMADHPVTGDIRSSPYSSMTTPIAPHSQSPASRFGSSLLSECSEVGCHHVKFAAWLSPSTHLPVVPSRCGTQARRPAWEAMHAPSLDR